MLRGTPNCISHLNNIDVEDLQYVERDLCFYELVSLGFLLYGNDHVNAQFVLQKLLVISNAPPNSSADLLRQYAQSNPNWKPFIIEALAIIKAKRVLHKLGFQWEELRQHYLPHIAELSVNVNPVIKSLYFLCERMNLAQAGRMVQCINDECRRPGDHLRFYDEKFLEINLLDWLSRKIIQVQGNDASNSNLQVMLNYFKQNELDNFKELLDNTIKSNSESKENGRVQNSGKNFQDSSNSVRLSTLSEKLDKLALEEQPQQTEKSYVSAIDNINDGTKYLVRKESAGIIIIVNQKMFYQDANPELQYLLPKKPLRERKGTDVDKEKVKRVFSSFGYTPLEFDNLTHIEMLHQIREATKRCFQYDSLIVCILSHGVDGSVFGCNSIPVEIAVIEQIMTDDTLQSKPKMLIVQACQKDDQPSEQKKGKIQALKSGPIAYMDIVKAMSTVPGYPSMRHTELGTWFIQSLCDKVDELGDKMHVLDILVSVTRAVTDKRGDQHEVMVPITINTLSKFYFLPKRK